MEAVSGEAFSLFNRLPNQFYIHASISLRLQQLRGVCFVVSPQHCNNSEINKEVNSSWVEGELPCLSLLAVLVCLCSCRSLSNHHHHHHVVSRQTVQASAILHRSQSLAFSFNSIDDIPPSYTIHQHFSASSTVYFSNCHGGLLCLSTHYMVKEQLLPLSHSCV